MNYQEYLCVYDPESIMYNSMWSTFEDDMPVPRDNCACDNCFYGRDKLAVHIRKLGAENNKLKRREFGVSESEALTSLDGYITENNKLKADLLYIKTKILDLAELDNDSQAIFAWDDLVRWAEEGK